MRPLLLVALLSALLATAPPARAVPVRYPEVGFGEQRETVFSNPFWQQLDLKPMRYVVGWDVLRYKWQTRELDSWMAAARAAGARPLLAITRSRAHWRTKVLPSTPEYVREFRRLRARYPDVKDYIAWNEANHCSQPLCHKPEVAAAYFDAMRHACLVCTIVALDVLDTPSMPGYVRDFKKAVKHRPKVWGLHNYVDANRLRTTGTRELLSLVKGKIWFTETGGLVKRSTSSPIKFPQSASHAGVATKFVLEHLATLSPRIQRIYLYHFQNQGPTAAWDSGVLNPHGKPRVAYRVVARWAERAAAARRAQARKNGR